VRRDRANAPHAMSAKFSQPEDISHAAVFLASDTACYITGASLPWTAVILLVSDDQAGSPSGEQ
jgi:NAD(P)-dependent dehydrogenase (short-subunit alcohol dehydrogenase family)